MEVTVLVPEYDRFLEPFLVAGRAFAFLKKGAGSCRGLAWLDDAPPRHRVISLLGTTDIQLPGISVRPLALPPLSLTSITSDRSLYYQKRDTVRLLVLDLQRPHRRRRLSVRHNGEDYTTIEADLDDRGAATALLQDLPAGKYEVAWQGAADSDPACAFTVAVYKLAPLVASILEERKEGPERLSVTLSLESYGHPVEGEVRLDLVERGRLRSRVTSRAVGGKAAASFTLAGQGPFHINVVLLSDPSRTATVPLRGSRLEERQETLFSSLGTTITGSLLPSAGSIPVRGLFLSSAPAKEESPFSIGRIDVNRVSITAARAASWVRVVTVDPSSLAASKPGREETRGGDCFIEARNLMAEGNMERARELLEREEPSMEESLLLALLYARSGRPAAAFSCLKDAMKNGWSDYEALTEQACWVDAGGEELCRRLADTRPREYVYQSLEAGETLEMELPSPAGLVAIGAFVDEEPWEGWAVTVAPETVTAAVEVPDEPLPGVEATVRISAPVETARAYVVVRDARLLTLDSPRSRLAGKLKQFAGETGACLAPPGRPDLQSLNPSRRRRLSLEKLPVSPGKTQGPGSEGIGDILVDQGLLSLRECQQALQEADRLHVPLQKVLADRGLVSEINMVQAIGASMGVPFIDLHGRELDPNLARSIPEHLAQRYRVIPAWQRDNTLGLAMVDPLNVFAIDDIRLITGFDIEPLIAVPAEVERAVNMCFGVTSLGDVEERVYDIAAADFGPVYDDEIYLDRLAFREEPAGVQLTAPGRDGDVPSPRPSMALPMDATGQQPQNKLERRAAAPEMLFAGFIDIQEGKGSVTVVTGPRPAEYQVEVLVLEEKDWGWGEARFRTNRSPLVEIEAPVFVHPGDIVTGRVRLETRGAARISLARDGGMVELRQGENVLAGGHVLQAGEYELTFRALPGIYHAAAEETESGRTSDCKAVIEEPGRILRRCLVPRWLGAGESIRLGEGGVQSIRLVSPELKHQLKTLLEATGSYEHLCCEQTAAKIMANCAMFMLNGKIPRELKKIEASVTAGIRRQREMFLPGKGFKMYPHMSGVDSLWGSQAACHLLRIGEVLDSALTPVLRRALEEGLQMALDAAGAYGLTWPPENPSSRAEAYGAACTGNPSLYPAALALARQGPARELSPVMQRADWAYGAAILLRIGADSDRLAAMKMANDVLAALGSQGRLYSTWDSMAAAALIREMSRVAAEKCLLLVNGEQKLTLREAAGFEGVMESVEVLEGEAMIETARMVDEGWADLSSTIPINVEMKSMHPLHQQGSIQAGDPVHLTVSIPDGYMAGDLLFLSLPEALSLIEGGGQLKFMALDFAGEQVLKVPLVATGTTLENGEGPGVQHFSVCVRNMYEETRVGHRGLCRVRVDASTSGEVSQSPLPFSCRRRPRYRAHLDLEGFMRTVNEAPIERVVNRIITQASRDDSPCIHLEPLAKSLSVWYRQGGELECVMEPPRHIHMPIIGRLLCTAGLDPTLEGPCSGYFKVSLEGRDYRWYLLVLPTLYGPKILLQRTGRGGRDLRDALAEAEAEWMEREPKPAPHMRSIHSCAPLEEAYLALLAAEKAGEGDAPAVLGRVEHPLLEVLQCMREPSPPEEEVWSYFQMARGAL